MDSRPIHISLAGQWTSNSGTLHLPVDPNSSWVVPGIIVNTTLGDNQTITVSFQNHADSSEFFRCNIGPTSPLFFPRPIKFPRGLGIDIVIVEASSGDFGANFFVPGPYQE